MNAVSARRSTLPVRGSLRWGYAASLVVGALIVIAAVGGLVDPTGVYPKDDLRRAFLPGDVVNLGRRKS